MKKSRLLCGVIATMSLGAISTSGKISEAKALDPDTRVIVELEENIEGLSSEEAISQQEALLSRIRHSVNPKIELVNNYSVLNNAMVISVNSEDIDSIRHLSGVAKVKEDKLHIKKSDAVSHTYSIAKSTDEKIDPNENMSARTMRKPGYDDGTGNILDGTTYDGEGTLIAILDNEFYFRGKNGSEEAWCHEVYTPLDSSVQTRFKSDTLSKNKYKYRELHADISKVGKAAPGTEGSLYFNNKVPFYYDYGGESLTYSSDAIPDFDVHSEIDYHGSHVSSITAANAPTYKGIAPKAQLACMKVFTEYKATSIGENLGFGNSSGAYDSCILSALEDCIKLDVDGINMSLGSDLDDFDYDSLTMRTLEKLVNESNIMSSISNGNAGKESYSSTGGYANWTKDMVETGILGSYANNSETMSIGSAHPDYIFYETGIRTESGNIAYDDQIVNNELYPAEYSVEYKMRDLVRDLSDSLEYQYIPGFGTASDYGTLDVEGKIAVVNRGSTSFADKYDVAINTKGAAGLFIINNDPTETDFMFRCSFGDDFSPVAPCAVVLFKDKPFFESHPNGEFTFIEKELSKNSAARTMSTFSTDGARFDLDLKPEISAPGDIIRGAVPPQKKEDRTETPLSTYSYLSGTSMSAPNYAGAQALILSETSAPLIQDGTLSNADMELVREARRTVDMRLMSTANPMLENDVNPETKTHNYASPRIQGAGMADIYGALNSKVYLEGIKTEDLGLSDEELLKHNVDQKENELASFKHGIHKSKALLRNNNDINNGKVNIKFLAHNEGDEAIDYQVKLTVMRPAIAENNDIISEEYNYISEVDSFEKLPGIQYYDSSYKKVVYTQGTASYRDVYKVTKELTYYKTKADYDKHDREHAVIIPQGTYFVSSKVYNAQEGVEYDVLPSKSYQSTKDIVLDTITTQTVTINPGDSVIKINPYSLTSDDREKILKEFPNGTFIEGYVELVAKTFDEDLNMPFLGFYAGGDVDSKRSYESAPAVEEFDFEKTYGQIYPSDLVNDLTKQLIGKDNVEFGSMMVAGYAPSTSSIGTERIIKNEINISQLNGFHKVGIDPYTNEYNEDVENNIYIGAQDKTNTLIIQQFVLRSCIDNYFEIKNKETGKVVYRSAMEDSLFGDTFNSATLYKSHVDASYLSAGYVAHRAMAIVPLYNESTMERYPDGEYELTFNYKLSATQTWVNKSYNLHLDNTPPEITNIFEKGNKVRIEMKDKAMSYVTVGTTDLPVSFDTKKNVYFVEVEKAFIDEEMNMLGRTSSGQFRLFISPVDKAYGSQGCIVHFTSENSYDGYDIVQGREFKSNNDFIKNKDGSFTFIEIDKYGNEHQIAIDSKVSTSNGTIVDKTGDKAFAIAVPLAVAVVLFVGGSIAILAATKKKKVHSK